MKHNKYDDKLNGMSRACAKESLKVNVPKKTVKKTTKKK